MSDPPLILASASPRRAELLRAHGYQFTICPAAHHEPTIDRPGLAPSVQAEALSYFKARSAAPQHPSALLLGADTIVASGGRIFGKPRSEAHAREILSALSGTTHEVITGVTVLWPARFRRRIGHAVTQVTMRTLAGPELDAYLCSGAWAGKAGAYGIQDRDDPFVTCVAGSFENVMGLPVEMVGRMLAAIRRG